MDSNKKYCIINAGLGNWYPKGSERLKKSLNYTGFTGEVLIYDSFPDNGFNKENKYNIKAACLQDAIEKGYTHILWADCSMWAINDPMPIFDIMNDKGFYAETNGNNCAQECNDFVLNEFQITRDEAEKISMCSSGLIGVNIENELGKCFAEQWIQASKNSLFNGSREHDSQSKDKRFLYHRQDQSVASLIINKLGLELLPLGTYWGYFPQGENKLFQCRGI